MCGINGIFAYHYAANSVNRRELLATRDYMFSRGPDGAGLWLSGDERIGLGHRRLAIIDLTESGAQPMRSADQRFTVTFNGEIYNYRVLRRELEEKGYVFRSESDTEVLLHLYADRGAEMVHLLRGMFAFAIWDDARRELFLARDPYGIKPLYYGDDGWTFRFASQMKALLAGGAVARAPDPAGEVGFYLFGHIPEPFTTCRAISALPAGCTLLIDQIGPRSPRRYHSIAQVYCQAEISARGQMSTIDAAAAFRAAVLDSVRHHLIADVPVGAFLSSGIDSTSLIGLMRDAGQQDIETVTISFKEFEGQPEDEAPLAAEVARIYGVKHTIRRVDEAEFQQDLPRILEAMDLPTIDAINTWFVAKAARELGLKVAISGVGGDELLGGYPSFKDVPRWVRLMAIPSRVPFLGCLARTLAQPASVFGVNPKAAGLVDYAGDYAGAYFLKRALFMPWELWAILPREIVVAGLARLEPLGLINRELAPRPSSPAARVSTFESTLYMRNQLLRDADWTSMAHSLELRTPLVDTTLLQKTAYIAAASAEAPSKALLADAPTRPLPSIVRERAKTGFTTPIATWQHRSPLAFGQTTPPTRPKGEPWARAWAGVVYSAAKASCHVA
jgi:asparagine synthase (glutamine-hydrolysing)